MGTTSISRSHDSGCTGGQSCSHRSCVNPRHLELVCASENILRGVSSSAAYAKRTHCERGHALTPENVYVRPNGEGRKCRKCIQER